MKPKSSASTVSPRPQSKKLKGFSGIEASWIDAENGNATGTDGADRNRYVTPAAQNVPGVFR